MIFKSSVFNSITLPVSIITTLLLTPFIIHSLGDMDFGIWTLLGSICGFYALLDLGISSSVLRFVSKFMAIGDQDGVNATINTSLFLYTFIAVLILMLAVFMGILLPLFVNVPQDKQGMVSTVLAIMGASLAISFPTRVFTGTLHALMRYDLNSYMRIILILLRAVLILIVLNAGYSLIAMSIVTFSLSIIELSVVILLVIKVYPDLKIARKFIEKKKIKQIFNYSIYRFIHSLGDLLRFNLDTVLIASFLSVSLIAPYAIVQSLIGYFSKFISSIFSVMLPMFSSYEAKNDISSVRDLLLKSTLYSAFVSFFIGAVLILYGDVFIKLWVGEEYVRNGYPVLVVLSISFAIALSQHPSITVAYGVEKHKFLSLLAIVEGAFNLVLTLILVSRMGLLGAALGTAIPMVLFKVFIQPVYICKIVEISVLNYMKTCFFKPFLSIGIFIILHTIIANYVSITSLFDFVFAVILSSLAFLLIAWFILSIEQKAYWRGIFISLMQNVFLKRFRRRGV